MPIPLKLQVFEGPMDLLMHLIEKNKIDIYDIPIVTITDQYLEYVRQMEHSDMNVTSEFLVMAATLLDIKSRMLLPREEDEEGEEEDPRDELVRRLLEYKMYKFMSEELREKSRHAGLSYFREQDLPEEVRSYVPPLNYEELIGDRTAQSLRNVFADVMKRRKSRVDPIRSGFGKINREVISVADKTLYIRAYLQSHPHADFREMLELQDSKEEIIVTFLVILELMKHQKIRITQEEAFGKILIDLVDPEEDSSTEEGSTEESFTEDSSTKESFTEDSSAVAEPLPEEPELTPELTTPEPIMIEPEPEPISVEPALEPEPVPEEPKPEPEPVPEEPADSTDEPDPGLIPEVPSEPSASVEKRHLVHRPRLGRYGIGIPASRFTARRSRGDLYRRARGNRIWKRKRNRGRVLRRIRKDKR